MNRSKAILCSASLLAMGWSSASLAQDAAVAQPEVAKDGEIVVSGIRASLSQAAEIKRTSDQVVDTIVAEDIGKFPDTTTAAALQRVPGVQVINGFNNEIINPLIRGIGDIITTLDGREIFTGVGRGFAFQDLPAEALARADVYKSNSAEKIEGGVAGNIDLRLRKPFDLKEGFTVSALGRATYGKNADKLSYNGGVLLGGRWAAGEGEMGALINLSYSDNNFNRPISFNCDPRSGTNGPPGAPGVVLPTCVGGLTDTGKYQRPQVNAAFQWRPSDAVEIYLDGMYSGYRAKFGTFFIFSDIFAAQNITNPQATDVCFQAPVNPAGFRSPTGTVQNLCIGSSATFNNVPGNTSTQAKRDKTDQYLMAGGVRVDDGPWKLQLDLSRFQSKTNQRTTIVDIGKRISQVNVDINDNRHGTTDMVGNPLADPAGFMFINSLFQDYRRADSTITQLMFDGTYKVGSILDEIQFGVRYADRKATFRGNAAGGPPASRIANRLVSAAALPAGFLISSPMTIPVINGGQHWLTPDPDFLRDNTDTLRALYGAPAGDPADSPTRSFDASEATTALYLQGRYSFDLGSLPVDGLIGGRYVLTDRTIRGTGVVTSGTPPVGVLTPVERSSSSSKFLPNASIRVQLTPDLQFRASYARTISQPTFSDLNPGLTYSVPSNANILPNGTGGNPFLKPQVADSYDATIEYYLGKGAYVAAAVYRRDIKGRVARNSQDEIIDGITYSINRPRNLGSSRLQGFEIGGQYFFDFLPEGLNGLGAFANFTYADTKVLTEGDLLKGKPLGGVSKYAYNVGVLYEKYGFHARAVYNWRDKYYDGTFTQLLVPDQQIYFNMVRPNGRLDVSVGYDVTENLTVNFEGVNLLKGKYLSYFDIPQFPHDIRIDDTFYGVSVRVKF